MSEDPLFDALTDLKSAAADAIRAGNDTMLYPMLNRQVLRSILSDTSALLEAHEVHQ